MSKAKYRLKPDAQVGSITIVPTIAHGHKRYSVLSIEESNGTPVANPLICLEYADDKAESYPQQIITLPLDAVALLCQDAYPEFQFWTLNKQYNPK